ncbi:hypothetical protein [Erwinia sp. E_sp_B01_9]|uniref:hypothetical protein n=1 Tax=Erwinia sp. E_sp_B01_9 TaxID=3039403 RepID=UPI003D9BE958
MAAMHTIEIADGKYAAAMLLPEVMYAADKLHGWLKFVEIGGLYQVLSGRLTRECGFPLFNRRIFCGKLRLRLAIAFIL